MKINALTFANFMRLLHTKVLTAPELAEQSGLHYVTVIRYLRALRSRGVVIVAGWVGEGTSTKAVYALATGTQRRDIERPPPMTVAERQAAMRRRRRERERSTVRRQTAREEPRA